MSCSYCLLYNCVYACVEILLIVLPTSCMYVSRIFTFTIIICLYCNKVFDNKLLILLSIDIRSRYILYLVMLYAHTDARVGVEYGTVIMRCRNEKGWTQRDLAQVTVIDIHYSGNGTTYIHKCILY